MSTPITCPAGHVGPFAYYFSEACMYPAVVREGAIAIDIDSWEYTDWGHFKGLTCEHVTGSSPNRYGTVFPDRCGIEFWPIDPVEINDDHTMDVYAERRFDEHRGADNDDAEYLVELSIRGLGGAR